MKRRTDIVCSQCGVSKDIDLGISIKPNCDCAQIDERANSQRIERRLIELVRRKVICWNIQENLNYSLYDVLPYN